MLCAFVTSVIRLPKQELLVLSQEHLKEILHRGRQLAVSGADAESSLRDSFPSISRGAMSALSNDLQDKMTAVGLLRQGDEAST